MVKKYGGFSMPIIHVSFKNNEIDLYNKIISLADNGCVSHSGWMKKAAKEKIDNDEAKTSKKSASSIGIIID